MNNPLFSHLYLHLKNILTSNKYSTFANLLLEKPGNLFAISKNVKKKKHLEKEI